MKTIESLKQATNRLCSAAKILQRESFCCNTFTLLVSREPSKLRGYVPDLVSISFQTLKELREFVSALRIEPTGGPPVFQWEDLLKCSAIGLKILRTFTPMSTLEPVHRDSLPDFRISSHLHIFSLVTQFLGLGMVFYAQDHLGPYSPLFLENPLTKMTPSGSARTRDRGCYIEIYLRNLTYLAGMVGDRVFVLVLCSAL